MADRIQGDHSESLLSPAAVAEMLGLSTRHVLRLPIKQVRIGHHTVRYRRAEVEEFLERRTSVRDRREDVEKHLSNTMKHLTQGEETYEH